MTDDLIAFLNARLDEDEAAVRALSEPHEWHTGPGDDPDWEDESTVYMWPPEHHTPYEQDKHWRGVTADNARLAGHIARHDPARVLRDVAAKRRRVERLADAVRQGHDDYDIASELFPLEALPYADHPEYRQEWAP